MLFYQTIVLIFAVHKFDCMKNIFLLLSLFMMFLLGARDINGALPVEEGEGVESVLPAEAPVGYILPIVNELPDTGHQQVPDIYG